MKKYKHITIFGAGPVGLELAYLLSFITEEVTVYEKRSQEECSRTHGRSINLALSFWGWEVLKRLHLYEQIRPLTVAMKGRMVHDAKGVGVSNQHLYSGHTTNDFFLWSANRSTINEKLITHARTRSNITIHFGVGCKQILPETGQIELTNNELLTLAKYDLVIGADGVGSSVRESLTTAGEIQSTRRFIGHGYSEIEFPAGCIKTADFENLHIWPLGSQMIIALPNHDGTLTGGVFGPQTGDYSFERIKTMGAAHYFNTYFPAVVQLVPDLIHQYKEPSLLSEVHSENWFWKNIVLVGDAAHGVVPYLGKGLNYGLHNASTLFDLLYDCEIEEALKKYQDLKPDADLLAEMSYRNFEEMANTHSDELTLLNQIGIALEGETNFLTLHSMISFTPLSHIQAEKARLEQETKFKQVLQLSNIYTEWNTTHWQTIKQIMTT